MLNYDLDGRTLGWVHATALGAYAGGLELDEVALLPGTGFQFHSFLDQAPGAEATTALPLTITSGTVRAVLTADATLGVVLNRFHDDSGAGQEFEPSSDLSAFDPVYNRTLWRIRGRTRAGELFDVGAADSDSFIARPVVVVSGENVYVFEWRGVALPNGDTLWVRIAAVGSASSTRVEWYGWCGREIGSDSRIEQFVYPVIALRNFAVPNGGDTALQAAYRLRCLIPMNEQNTMPVGTINMPVGMLAFVGFGERTIGHPGPFWFSAFAAVSSGASFDAANYRRTFMLQARDPEQNYKQLAFRFVNVAAETYVLWRHEMVPAFERAFASGPVELNVEGDPLLPESEWDNSVGPHYAVDLTAFQAVSDEWWYDCCERYRTAFRLTTTVVPKNLNPDLSTFGKGPHILLATITLDQVKDSPWMLTDLIELVDLYIAAHENAHIPLTNRLLVHFQTWQYGWRNVNHCSPDFSDVIDQVAEAIRMLEERGVRVSLYTRIQDDWLRRGWLKRMGLAARPGCDIDGNQYAVYSTETNDTAVVFDKRSRVFREFGVGSLQAGIVAKMGLGAIYSDAYVGGIELLYTPCGEGHARVANGHGGNSYHLAKVDTIARQRALFRQHDPQFIVFAEGVEEGLPMDWQNGGYEMIPGHPELSDTALLEAIFGAGLVPTQFTDMGQGFRHPLPPIWQAIHSAAHAHGRFSVTPTRGFMEGNELQPATFGLTPAEWLASTCCAWACLRIIGCNSWFFSHAMDNYQPCARLTDGGDTISAFPEDTYSAGPKFLAFSKMLFESMLDSYAGQFLISGDMQRPAQVDHASVLVQLQTNPAFYHLSVYGRNGEVPNLEYGWFIYAQQFLPFGEKAWQVVSILHSVWRSPAGVIGMVLINWTDAAQAWEGTFTRANYGIGAGNLNVNRLTLGGAPVLLGTTAAASFTLRSAAAPGGTIYLGHLAARSITVLTFTL